MIDKKDLVVNNYYKIKTDDLKGAEIGYFACENKDGEYLFCMNDGDVWKMANLDRVYYGFKPMTKEECAKTYRDYEFNKSLPKYFRVLTDKDGKEEIVFRGENETN